MDDNGEEDDHDDDNSETRQPVDTGDNHNDLSDNDQFDCDNLVEDSHETLTKETVRTKK